MADQARNMVEQQVGRIRWRLFWQIALQTLLVAWAIGFMLCTVWFLARPFLADLGPSVQWGIPGGIVGLATIVGCAAAWMRRPSLLSAALSLDDRCGLKERVITYLTLSDEELQSAAGQALTHDVVANLANLQVGSRYSLHIAPQHLLLPAGALALALIACVFDPFVGDVLQQWNRKDDTNPLAKRDVKEIEQKLENLKKIVSQRSQDELPKSEKLQEMEKEFKELINKPLDVKNEEKVRERINEFRKLEDKLKERLDQLREKAEKIDALKNQLKKLDLDKDKLKDGPAKDFENALMNGQLDKAQQALEKLIKDMKNDKLSKEDQKKLAEQFKDLQEKLKDLQEKNKDLMDQLKKRVEEGKISPEQANRELQALKDLKDLTDVIGDAKDALEKNNPQDAADKLDKAQKNFNDIELTEDEIRDILRDQREIDDAMRALQGRDGDGEDDDGDGMGGGGKPGRRRPIDPNDPDSKIRNQRQKAEIDAKGIQRITGYARGGNFNKIPAKSVEGAFRQAVQEAPEAIERQRIPDDAADIARKYFERLGGQSQK
jgi:hypothetical protein